MKIVTQLVMLYAFLNWLFYSEQFCLLPKVFQARFHECVVVYECPCHHPIQIMHFKWRKKLLKERTRFHCENAALTWFSKSQIPPKSKAIWIKIPSKVHQTGKETFLNTVSSHKKILLNLCTLVHLIYSFRFVSGLLKSMSWLTNFSSQKYQCRAKQNCDLRIISLKAQTWNLINCESYSVKCVILQRKTDYL